MYDSVDQFDRAVRLFGEDNSTIQPDDFFGIFDLFLTSFNEAKHDLENIRKRRDEEEKRAKQEIEVKWIGIQNFHLQYCSELLSIGLEISSI